MTDKPFRPAGVNPAQVTPFTKDGAVDEAAYHRRRLDAVRRRRQWQDTLDKDRFFDQVFSTEESAHEVKP